MAITPTTIIEVSRKLAVIAGRMPSSYTLAKYRHMVRPPPIVSREIDLTRYHQKII